MKTAFSPSTRRALVTALLTLGLSCAQATVLTFDGVSFTRADKGQVLTYHENGWTFTFSACATCYTHYNDGSGVPDVLRWHEGGDNPADLLVTLTNDAGSAFDLLGFDVKNRVAVNGLEFGIGGAGILTHVDHAFPNLDSATFRSMGWMYIDNVALRTVAEEPSQPTPEPSSLALAGLALAAVGAGVRRRRVGGPQRGD